jgi:hypothetical protein
MSLYINGALAAQDTTTVRPMGELSTLDNPGLGIGNHSGGAQAQHSYPFDGIIDELTLYNEALTAQHVKAIYTAGSAGKCAEFPSVAASALRVTDAAKK